MKILLKLSWEAMAQAKPYGLDMDFIRNLCKDIIELKNEWFQIAIVIWWGNIFRWWTSDWLNMTAAHNMWMLATVLNGIALQDIFNQLWEKSIHYTSRYIDTIGKMYRADEALANLEEWKILICTTGTWNPFFTTDTAGALRASELKCNYFIKLTQVDYLYDSDPKKNLDAKPIIKSTYKEAIEKDLKVMDLTAFVLARDNNLKTIITSISKLKELKKLNNWEIIGTLIEN